MNLFHSILHIAAISGYWPAVTVSVGVAELIDPDVKVEYNVPIFIFSFRSRL